MPNSTEFIEYTHATDADFIGYSGNGVGHKRSYATSSPVSTKVGGGSRLYIDSRNFFFLSMPAVSGGHDLGQGNVSILQHLQSDRRDSASTKLFLNPSIQFYLNSVTNLHQLTSQHTTTCPTT